VGLDHVVAALNPRVHVQSRTGSDIGTAYPRDVWAAVLPKGYSPFEPRIVFDHFAQKWVMIYAAREWGGSGSALLIGVSETADPTSRWFLHRIDIDPAGKYWLDFPMLGFNEGRIVVAGWLIPKPKEGLPYRVAYYVFEKDDLRGGSAGRHTKFWLPPLYLGAPAVQFDKGQKELLLVDVGRTYSPSRIYQIAGDLGRMTLSPRCEVQPKWNWRIPRNAAPQSGTSVQIAVDADYGQAVVRNSSIWMVQNVSPTPAAAGARAAIQWWQIEGSGKVIQQGVLDDPSGKYLYIYPSLAVNKENDVLVGYTRCSADSFPSACFAYCHRAL
jgi:hypothetical protein